MYPTVSLQPGSSNSVEVKKLQDFLLSQGLLTAAQIATGPGIYGPLTTAAVKAYQEKMGVDNKSGPGYWGPLTIAKAGSTPAKPTDAPSTGSVSGVSGVKVDNYGYNENLDLEKRAKAIEGSVESSAKSSGLVDPNFLNNLIAAKPDVIAFYVHALTYGGYTIGDVLNDMKRRELESKGDVNAKNLKIIDPEMKRSEYQATAEGQKAVMESSKILPTFDLSGIMNPEILKYGADMDEETFKTLVPILDPTSLEFKDAVANIKSSFYDMANAQLLATNEQEKAAADYNYNEFKKQVETNFGIKLSDDAAAAWKQITGLEDSMNTRGLAGSGFQAEGIDNYLKTTRLADQRLRDQKVVDANNKELEVLKASGTPSEIAAAIAKMDAEDRAKGIPQNQYRSTLLKPSGDVASLYSVANLKSKYPDMTDAQIAAYRNSVLDENGNLRSAIYSKYYSGVASNLKSAKDAAETLVTTKALSDEQRAYGDPNNVLTKPTDVGSAPQATGLVETPKVETPKTETPAVSGVSAPVIKPVVPTPVTPPAGYASVPDGSGRPIYTAPTPAATSTPTVTANLAPVAPAAPAPVAPKVTTPTAPARTGYQGVSVVDYLSSTGADSSYTNRAKLAAAQGITGYTGSATQNTQLLTKMRGY